MEESESTVVRCLMEAMEQAVPARQAKEDCGCKGRELTSAIYQSSYQTINPRS